MKRIEDIEEIGVPELERISLDDSIMVPEGMSSRMENLIDSLEMSERLLAGPDDAVRHVRHRWWGAVGAAASLALLIGIGISAGNGRKDLVDTYDDPMLAYAEVQKAMLKISGGMKAGVDGVRKSNECMELPMEILNRTINNRNN